MQDFQSFIPLAVPVGKHTRQRELSLEVVLDSWRAWLLFAQFSRKVHALHRLMRIVVIVAPDPILDWRQPRLHRLSRVSRRIFATTRQLYVFFN